MLVWAKAFTIRPLGGAVNHPSSHDGDANLAKWAAVMLAQSIRVRSDPAEFLSVLPQTP